MLIVPPPKPRKPREIMKAKKIVPTPPVPALNLVSATYDGGAQQVTLQFDRAIDVSAMDLSQVVVLDGIFRGGVMTGWRTPNLTAPDTVVIDLNEGDSYRERQYLLEATASTGVVAVDNGGTWAGATDLVLPFP